MRRAEHLPEDHTNCLLNFGQCLTEKISPEPAGFSRSGIQAKAVTFLWGNVCAFHALNLLGSTLSKLARVKESRKWQHGQRGNHPFQYKVQKNGRAKRRRDSAMRIIRAVPTKINPMHSREHVEEICRESSIKRDKTRE